MKDVIEFCESEINKCNTVLNPLLEKQGFKNVMAFLPIAEVLDKDVHATIKNIHHRDALIKVVNVLNTQYVQGIHQGDPDADSKKRAIYAVGSKVLERVTQEGAAPWERMDGVTTESIQEHLQGCIMANELELAMLGIVYLLYQKHFQKTNRADKMLEELHQPKENNGKD